MWSDLQYSQHLTTPQYYSAPRSRSRCKSRTRDSYVSDNGKGSSHFCYLWKSLVRDKKLKILINNLLNPKESIHRESIEGFFSFSKLVFEKFEIVFNKSLVNNWGLIYYFSMSVTFSKQWKQYNNVMERIY